MKKQKQKVIGNKNNIGERRIQITIARYKGKDSTGSSHNRSWSIYNWNRDKAIDVLNIIGKVLYNNFRVLDGRRGRSLGNSHRTRVIYSEKKKNKKDGMCKSYSVYESPEMVRQALIPELKEELE